VDIIWFDRYPTNIVGLIKKNKSLQYKKFDGVMYPYIIDNNDYFTKISRIMEKDNFKYIVAIRPYSISPQYLSKMCSSIKEINDGVLSINFVSGWIHEEKKDFGGILSEINDNSSNIERSNYMLEYTKEFKNISDNNFYVSTTNETVFNFCAENDFPMIIPYSWYTINKFDLTNKKYIISICPIIGDEKTDSVDIENFSENEFIEFLRECELKNIEGLLIMENKHNSQYPKISTLVKRYRDESTIYPMGT
jgi:hypothetical protein